MAKSKKQVKRIIKREAAMLPGYIIVVLWCAFTLLALIWVFLASLSTTPEIFTDRVFSLDSGLHFENYAKAWGDGKFSVYFGNSIFYVVVSGVLSIAISAPAAYVLSRFKFKGNAIFQRMFIVGMSIPGIMIVMPLFSLAIQFGLTNSRGTLTFIYICGAVPFSVFFLMGFFRGLPSDFEEAAVIDGCSQAGAFWRIMFPLASPGVFTLALFNLLGTWNDYFNALIFANKTEIKPVGLGLYNILQNMRYTSDYAGLFAAIVIGIAPTLILFVFLSDKIMSGVTAGGIKQ